MDRIGSHEARVRRRRWPWITPLVIVGGIGIIAGVFGVQAITVQHDLLTAKSELSSLGHYVKSGDSAKIDAVGDNVLKLTRDANSTVRGPLWQMASGIPLVGQNVDAVRRATEATSILAEGALPAGVKLLSSLRIDKMSVSGGGVDLEPIEKAAASLPEINAAFASAKTKLDGVDRASLLPFVDSAIGSLFDVMDQAGPILKDVQHYLPTLLKVAGADGPRTYMLIFQNNAESRATGGLPAATAIVNVDNGHLKLQEQTSTFTFPRDRQVIFPPEQTQSIYEADTFKGFGNFSRTPNFPTTGEAFAALWHNTTGGELDGVISLDPVVLSHMLEVTGPIKTADGRKLTSDNVVEALLYDAYIRYKGNTNQDAFFSDVAARVFLKLSSGDWDITKMLDQLGASISEHRLYAWFPREAEQNMAVEMKMDGTMTVDNKKATEVGIYINDAAYSKLEFFMKTSMNVTCDVAKRTVTTSLTIANSVPMTGLTSYQLGIRNKRYQIPREDFVQDIMFSAPPGAEITKMDPEQGDAWDGRRSGVENGHEAQVVRIFVPHEQTRTVSFTVRLPKGQLGPLLARTTPTVTTTPVSIAPTCAPLFTAP